VGGRLSASDENVGQFDLQGNNLKAFVSPVRFNGWDANGGGTLRIDNISFQDMTCVIANRKSGPALVRRRETCD